MVLPSPRNDKHGAGSAQTKQFPSKGYGYQPWLWPYSWSIYQPRPRSQTGALASAGGFRTKAYSVTYCAMPYFLHYEPMTKPWNFDFLLRREYYEKLRHMLKPLVLKFCPDLSIRLKDIAEKQFPARQKPIVGSIHSIFAKQQLKN